MLLRFEDFSAFCSLGPWRGCQHPGIQLVGEYQQLLHERCDVERLFLGDWHQRVIGVIAYLLDPVDPDLHTRSDNALIL